MYIFKPHEIHLIKFVKLGTISIFLPAKIVVYNMLVKVLITQVNMRMNIHRKGKSDCEHSISHYKNVCKCASFSIQILEKLEEDGFRNGQQDFTGKSFVCKEKIIG